MSRKVHRHPATPRPARAIERDRGMRDAFDLDPNDVFARESRTESTPRAFAARERVECEFFLRDAPTVDARDADADAFVDAARVVVNAEIDAIAFEHVWNREKFFVEVVGEGRGNDSRRRLGGGVSYGDCVDDCWYVAHIAREITLRHVSIVLAARVWDEDGEFLLIETAETLPRWVTPRRATGTTFLRRGELVVVDADSVRESDEGEGDVTTRAIERVERARALGPMTQKVLRERLDACPARARGPTRGVRRRARVRGESSASRTAAHRVRDREFSREGSERVTRGGEDGDVYAEGLPSDGGSSDQTSVRAIGGRTVRTAAVLSITAENVGGV